LRLGKTPDSEDAQVTELLLDQPDHALDLLKHVLQERPWLAAAMAGQAAGVPYLEQLRSVQTALYGVASRQVEQTTAISRKQIGKPVVDQNPSQMAEPITLRRRQFW